ncbi:putative acyltransferase [Rhizomicrobium palustre]|uniref:Putative acyltransferase n=1 Tax=Rhizomicrobium palustre TaxID=189966 RepID=A0A846N0X6_9PROT|nr:heparan-alpha-glucosaminide N-acetyltransferase domain-containing protein [Rhizomicrobium palustre]NIK88892.1 putative acyltransferase [Rhizomicrobium palustre]
MAKERNIAIDVFRGLTIFLMIVVNTMGPGAEPYPVLAHADWFGFTFADFVFPSFLFVMGSSLAFVAARPMPDHEYLFKVLRRAGLLFAIGFFMYWFPFVHVTRALTYAPNLLSEVRIMGVLQRIALCYAAAALAVRYFSPRQLIALSVALLACYWASLVFMVAPGDAFDRLNNIGTVIDRAVLGQSHMWRWDGGFEPEGLLGTVPATVNVLAGYLAIRFLKRDGRRLGVLALCGVALTVVALGLDESLPISKKLWTPSFVLLTVGLDFILLAALAAVLDLWKLPVRTGFFEVFGKNPLAIYLFSELLIPLQALFKPLFKIEPYQWLGVAVFQRLAPGALGSLLCAIAFTLLCWLFGYILYRQRLYIRL